MGAAAVDQADEDGGTPLWVACFYGHLELAKFLVKSQASASLVYTPDFLFVVIDFKEPTSIDSMGGT